MLQLFHSVFVALYFAYGISRALSRGSLLLPPLRPRHEPRSRPEAPTRFGTLDPHEQPRQT
eukprot:12358940-Alexandrium_andersonii.AAC.1